MNVSSFTSLDVPFAIAISGRFTHKKINVHLIFNIMPQYIDDNLVATCTETTFYYEKCRYDPPAHCQDVFSKKNKMQTTFVQVTCTKRSI